VRSTKKLRKPHFVVACCSLATFAENGNMLLPPVDSMAAAVPSISLPSWLLGPGYTIAWPFREMFHLLPGNISGRELAILCLLTQGLSTEINTIEMRLSGCFQLPLF
jgi:hypothetical protein